MPADLTMNLDDACAAVARAAEEACVRIRNVAQEVTFQLEQAAGARAAQGDKPLELEGADAVLVVELEQLATFDTASLNLAGIMHFFNFARPQLPGRYKLTLVLKRVRPAER